MDDHNDAKLWTEDLLRGVRRIAREIGFSEKVTYQMLQAGEIPGSKIRGQWLGSRTALREHFTALARRINAA